MAPLVGGSLAGLLYEHLFAVNASLAKTRGFFTRDYDDKQFDAPAKTSDQNESKENHREGAKVISAVGNSLELNNI